MAEPSISGAKQKSSLKAVVALLGDLLEQRLDGDIGLDSLLQGEGTVPIALTLLVGAGKVRDVPGTIDEVHGKKVKVTIDPLEEADEKKTAAYEAKLIKILYCTSTFALEKRCAMRFTRTSLP